MRIINAKRRFKWMITAIMKYRRNPHLSEAQQSILGARLMQYQDLLDYANSGRMQNLPANGIIKVSPTTEEF
tara:strand:- start:852 stop:1067 length:216 start_codon:yes stop_codon:yes gene_type:complete